MMNLSDINFWKQKLVEFLKETLDLSQNSDVQIKKFPNIQLRFEHSPKIGLNTKLVSGGFEIVFTDAFFERLNWLHTEILNNLECEKARDDNITEVKNAAFQSDNTKIDFDIIMYISSLAVLLHELGHILNGHLGYLNSRNNISEHVLEMDADAFALTQLMDKFKNMENRFLVVQGILLGLGMPQIINMTEDIRGVVVNNETHYDMETRILGAYQLAMDFEECRLNNLVIPFIEFLPLIDTVMSKFLMEQGTPISDKRLFDGANIDEMTKQINDDNHRWLQTIRLELESFAYIPLYDKNTWSNKQENG